MFENMRRHLMEWFAKRRQIDTNVPEGQIIVSMAINKIQKLTLWQARHYRILPATNMEFEVLSLRTMESYTVKLQCTCFEWESTGIPCSHAIAVILFHKKNPQTYTQAFLSLDGYHKTYANAILPPNADTPHNKPASAFLSPENGDNNSERDILAPPRVNRLPGRPRVRRIRSGVEGSFGNKRVKRCGCCEKFGHAVTICDSAI
jgi:zinc finger SWIM domain-containing protein 3